jgi:hypothetical protein
MSIKAVFAPCSAKRRVIAAPMPPPPPVTKTTLPLRLGYEAIGASSLASDIDASPRAELSVIREERSDEAIGARNFAGRVAQI